MLQPIPLWRGVITALLTAQTLWSGPVSYYGQMEAQGNRVYGAKTGLAMQARGVSLYWNNSGWGGEGYWNAPTVHHLADNWNIELVRAAYAPDLWDSNRGQIEEVVNAALEKDIYVIIDFHAHDPDGDKAAWFFDELGKKYGKEDNVIWEVFNEPRPTFFWEPDIKPHVDKAIETIRKHSDNLILVGNRTWSQRPDEAAAVPVDDNNVAYVMHFYVGSHGWVIRDHTEAAMGRPLTQEEMVTDTLVPPVKPVPIFTSEWGYWPPDMDNIKPDMEPFGRKGYVKCNHDGCVDVDMDGYEWMDFMNRFQMSWASWSMGNKDEPSSFFNGDVNNLTHWGQFLKDHINNWTTTQAPWNFAATISPQKAPLERKELIDNIDDNGRINFWLGAWSSENDHLDSGATTVTESELLAVDQVIKMEFTFKNEMLWRHEPYAKVVMQLNADGTSQDLSECSTIQYDYKGRAHHFRVIQKGVADHHDYHKTEVAASEDWATATVDWNSLKQPGWVSELAEIDQQGISAFIWQVYGPDGTNGELLLDNVACLDATPPEETEYSDEVPEVSSSSIIESSNSSESETEFSSVEKLSSQKGTAPSTESEPSSAEEISPLFESQSFDAQTHAIVYQINNEPLQLNTNESGYYSISIFNSSGSVVAKHHTLFLQNGINSLSHISAPATGLFLVKMKKLQ